MMNNNTGTINNTGTALCLTLTLPGSYLLTVIYYTLKQDSVFITSLSKSMVTRDKMYSSQNPNCIWDIYAMCDSVTCDVYFDNTTRKRIVKLSSIYSGVCNF